MGADIYTVGRPHPMIDSTLRKQRILVEGRDPQVAILLLDFILGLKMFAESLEEQEVEVVQVDWVPPAHPNFTAEARRSQSFGPFSQRTAVSLQFDGEACERQ